MPLGLCNTPATFQRTFEILFYWPKWSSYIVNVDDVIVSSESLKDHTEYAYQVLTIVRDAVSSPNLVKCHFFRASADCLGYVIVLGILNVVQKNTYSIKQAKF